MRTIVLSSLLGVGGCVLLLADAFGYPQQVDKTQPVDPRVEAVETAEGALQQILALRSTGAVIVEQETHYTWSHRLAEAKLSLTDDGGERIAVIEEHVERTEVLYSLANRRIRTGGTPNFGPLQLLEAKYFLAEARMMLQEEQARADATP